MVFGPPPLSRLFHPSRARQIPRLEDRSGLHQQINTSEGGYRIPPNSLISFIRYCPEGTWTAPNGVRPGCGCYEVHAVRLPCHSYLAATP